MVVVNEFQIRGNCRCCKFFHRVFEHNYRNIQNIRGFCRLGRMNGEYSLLVSTSFDRECPAFVRDEYNTETSRKEHELKQDFWKFEGELIDNRTRLAKLIEKSVPDNEEIKKFFKEGDKNSRWVTFHMRNEFRTVFYELFLQMHKEQFDWLYNRKYINDTNYFSFLNKLRTNFSKFVEVDGLENVVRVYE